MNATASSDANGDPLRYDAILEDFQQASKRAKITEGFSGPDSSPRPPGFHDLRRSFARGANRAGIRHRTILEIAGWKSEAMLLPYLGDTKPSEQRAAFERLAISTSFAQRFDLSTLFSALPGWRNGRR
jgi:integrase